MYSGRELVCRVNRNDKSHIGKSRKIMYNSNIICTIAGGNEL